MFDLTKEPSKERVTKPGKHVPAFSVASNCQKLKLQRKKEVSGSSERLHNERHAFGEDPWDIQNGGTL